MDVPLSWYLVVAAALFCIGLYGVLSRRNAIAILMGVELMLIVITVAAAEAAVGLALIIAVYRNRRTVDVDEVDLMKL
jgi:NADH:ubiquinone oxidoreductase subunit K